MNLPEWPYLSIGSIAGAINGLFPFAFALVLSEILAVSCTVYEFAFIRKATSFYYAIVRYNCMCKILISYCTSVVYMQLLCTSWQCLMRVVRGGGGRGL